MSVRNLWTGGGKAFDVVEKKHASGRYLVDKSVAERPEAT